MSLGAVTLGALALAIVLSCTSRLNVGLLALALAWIIGVYVGDLPLREVTAGFPIDLFLTLAGVTLLFAQAHVNGTLDIVAQNAMRLCRGRVGVVPIMYFALGAVLASAGPGNIATTGLLAPMAMATALKMRISPFLMAIMVGNGCNSGSLSPFAPTGLIVSGLMERIGLPGFELQTWAYNLLAHAIVAFAGYFLFGGWKLLMRSEHVEVEAEPAKRLDVHQTLTLIVIALLILGVIIFNFNIGLAAFTGAVLLSLLRAADDGEAIKRMPWGTILMVCGVTVLIALLADDGRHGHLREPAVEHRDAGDGRPGAGRRHRHRLGVLEHLGRRLAGLPADGAGPHRESRRRQRARHCIDDEHRRASRRRLAAVDDWRALHRVRARGRA